MLNARAGRHGLVQENEKKALLSSLNLKRDRNLHVANSAFSRPPSPTTHLPPAAPPRILPPNSPSALAGITSPASPQARTSTPQSISEACPKRWRSSTRTSTPHQSLPLNSHETGGREGSSHSWKGGEEIIGLTLRRMKMLEGGEKGVNRACT